MSKQKAVIMIICVAAAILATASFIFIKPIPKAQPIPVPPPRLNLMLTNEMSDRPELAGLDRKVERYLNKWFIKGGSLAIMRNDSLLYAKGYGWAEEDKGLEMKPNHIMRMASVSKLITAVGVMALQDKEMISIKDTVFGPSGILHGTPLDSLIKDKNCHKITIEHLLRHQGGFFRDPLFSSRDIMTLMDLDHAPEADDYFRFILPKRLRFMPGEWQRYSNFGYLLLSRIIEEVTGKPYADFIKEDVLLPAGVYDMHIAGIYYEDKRDNEVRYYTHEGDGKFIEEYNNSGRIVERCYGGNNIPMLSGAGAWCGSPAELARFVASIDGRDEVPDIISKEAIAQMTEFIDTDTYALGWNDTNPEKGWNRTGTLSGTTALVQYFPDGECWILITNTSTWKGPGQARYTNELFKQCRELYSVKLPAINLFEEQPIY